MSQILTFQYLSDVGNADMDLIRCAAFHYAKAEGESGVCLVLVSVEGWGEPVQVVANLNANEASIVLPLFDWEKELSIGTAFGLRDTVYIISDCPGDSAMQEAANAFESSERLFFFALRRADASLTGFWLDRSSGTWIPVIRSAEGAAAAAIVLHRDLESGTMESTVSQPGGILEIGLRKDRSCVLGLSAGGPVEVLS